MKKILERIKSNRPVIVWGTTFLNQETMENATHHVTGIYVDSHSSIVTVNIEKGTSVDQIKISMEAAQEIGFINIQALSKFCK